MKVSKTQALKAINGATADEVYNALDFSQLPMDEENNLSPTLDDVIEALSGTETTTYHYPVGQKSFDADVISSETHESVLSVEDLFTINIPDEK